MNGDLENKLNSIVLLEINKARQENDTNINNLFFSYKKKIDEKILHQERDLNIVTSQLNNIIEKNFFEKVKKETLDELLVTKRATDKTLYDFDLRMSNINSNLTKLTKKFDLVFLENFDLSGVIGKDCEFLNMRSFIEEMIRLSFDFKSFKEKTLLDLRNKKEMIEMTHKMINDDNKITQKNVYEISERVHQVFKGEMKGILEILENDVRNIKIDNGKYHLEAMKKVEKFKKEIEDFTNKKNIIEQTFTQRERETTMLKQLITQVISNHEKTEFALKEMKDEIRDLREIFNKRGKIGGPRESRESVSFAGKIAEIKTKSIVEEVLKELKKSNTPYIDQQQEINFMNHMILEEENEDVSPLSLLQTKRLNSPEMKVRPRLEDDSQLMSQGIAKKTRLKTAASIRSARGEAQLGLKRQESLELSKEGQNKKKYREEAKVEKVEQQHVSYQVSEECYDHSKPSINNRENANLTLDLKLVEKDIDNGCLYNENTKGNNYQVQTASVLNIKSSTPKDYYPIDSNNTQVYSKETNKPKYNKEGLINPNSKKPEISITNTSEEEAELNKETTEERDDIKNSKNKNQTINHNVSFTEEQVTVDKPELLLKGVEKIKKSEMGTQTLEEKKQDSYKVDTNDHQENKWQKDISKYNGKQKQVKNTSTNKLNKVLHDIETKPTVSNLESSNINNFQEVNKPTLKQVSSTSVPKNSSFRKDSERLKNSSVGSFELKVEEKSAPKMMINVSSAKPLTLNKNPITVNRQALRDNQSFSPVKTNLTREISPSTSVERIDEKFWDNSEKLDKSYLKGYSHNRSSSQYIPEYIKKNIKWNRNQRFLLKYPEAIIGDNYQVKVEENDENLNLETKVRRLSLDFNIEGTTISKQPINNQSFFPKRSINRSLNNIFQQIYYLNNLNHRRMNNEASNFIKDNYPLLSKEDRHSNNNVYLSTQQENTDLMSSKVKTKSNEILHRRYKTEV